MVIVHDGMQPYTLRLFEASLLPCHWILSLWVTVFSFTLSCFLLAQAASPFALHHQNILYYSTILTSGTCPRTYSHDYHSQLNCYDLGPSLRFCPFASAQPNGHVKSRLGAEIQHQPLTMPSLVTLNKIEDSPLYFGIYELWSYLSSRSIGCLVLLLQHLTTLNSLCHLAFQSHTFVLSLYHSRVRINATLHVQGTANFGPAGSTGATVTSLEDAQRMLDVYLRYGNTIDTSNRYTEGNSGTSLVRVELLGYLSREDF